MKSEQSVRRSGYELRVLFASAILLFSLPLQAGRIWFDGSVDEADGPPGKLLSDNADYWGEVVLTGVEYYYPVAPDNPPDDRPDSEGRLMRTLLNGNRGNKRNVGVVGMQGDKPLVVEFDFKRSCRFTEFDLVTPPAQITYRIELRETTNDGWLVGAGVESAPEEKTELSRIPLAQPEPGRYARVTVERSGGKVQLCEVLAWGDATVDETTPEHFTPIAEGQYPVGVTFPTLTGISKSTISDREAFYWVQSLTAEQRQQAALWAAVPTWDSISHQPLIPAADQINQPVNIVMARNETEAVALALKNTLVDTTQAVEIVVGEIRNSSGAAGAKLSLRLGVMGSIGSRNFGNNLGPIMEAGNLPGRALLRKFLLNGAEIADLPRVTLPPAGGVVCWLTVTSDGAAPGNYHTTLRIAGGEELPINIEVVDVTLPRPFAFVKTYSDNRTTMFPFIYDDRTANDINYALDCGISDWRANDPDFSLIREMAAARSMQMIYYMGHITPYVGEIWLGRYPTAADLPANTAQKTVEAVNKAKTRAAELGLAYDEWYGGTADEPGPKNMAVVAEVCRLVKAADPKVNFYLNPCYWSGYDHGGVHGDEVVAPQLAGWYNKDVDISLPLFLLLDGRPEAFKSFSAPRKINGYYYVSGQLDRSEAAVEIEKYRRMAWYSFSLGFNGWAFYAYYSPRASAWNHYDRNPPGEGLREPSDYQMVYPGPRGVIRTRHSEALREGWEDWCLLHLLREQGQERELDVVMAGFQAGRSYSELRLQALRAAAAGGTK